MAALIGEEQLKERLGRHREAFSLFSGIECVRHAWAFINAAAVEMWGLSPGLDFKLSAIVSVHRFSVTFEDFILEHVAVFSHGW